MVISCWLCHSIETIVVYCQSKLFSMMNSAIYLKRGPRQLIIVVLVFVIVYVSLTLNKPEFWNFAILLRFEDIEFTSCNNISGHTINKFCHEKYQSFPAYYHLQEEINGRNDECWKSFDYVNGISKAPSPDLQKNIKELLDSKCVDGLVRPFVNVQNTNKSLKLKCSNCSLVFSSGRLIDSHLGSQIDSHECVLRLNNAPTKGFERDVGRKTTVRIMAHNALYESIVGPHILSVVPKNDKQIIVVWDPPPTGKMSIDNKVPQVNIFQLASKLNTLRPSTSVYYSSSQYFDNLWLELTGMRSNTFNDTIWISTGFYSYVIAMNICERTNIYGSLPENYCETSTKWAPYHYYPYTDLSRQIPGDCSTYRQHQDKKFHKHLFLTEQKVFRLWAQYRNINFVPLP